MDPQALVQSTSSLNNISRSFNGLAAGITRSSFLARSIAKTVKTDNIGKKKLLTSDATYFRRRRESFLRRRREDQLEASTVNGASKARGKAITNTGKGVLGRILNFLGIVLIGFVVQRLPQILKAITAIIKRITQVIQIFMGFINGIIGVFDSMSSRLDQVIGMLRFWDFDKQKDEAEDAFQNVTDKLNNLNTSFIRGVNRYQDDKNLDEEIERIEAESQQKERFFGGTDDPGAKNQWWDFLDMFPNKNKTEGEGNEDGEKDDIKEEVKNEVLEYFEGGEIKAGQTALVGEGKDGKSKDRELFVPKQDGFILPNNITEKLMEASSFLESNKLKNSMKSTAENFDIGTMTDMMKGFSSVLDSMSEVEDPSKNIESIGEELKTTLQSQMRGLVESGESKSVIDSIKGISKSLKPEMEGLAFDLKDVIDDSDIKSLFESTKTDFDGIIKEITPERKGQKIMMPPPPGLGADAQSKSTPQHSGGISKAGAKGGGVNIKEYHKHLTTLITSYT